MKSLFIRVVVSLLLALFSFQTQAHAMTTSGNQILNSDGQPVELKGVNWFGFNNQSTMVDGLWGGPDSISFDFATVVYRMQLLGFNAIRLPFSFKDLYQLPPRNYAQGCALASQSAIQASVTNPAVPVPAGKTIPPMTFPVSHATGTCNDYLPNDSTINRFLWVINFFAKNGFYVLIDNHFREDQTVLDSQATWLQDWIQLANAIAKDPISKKRIMFDLLNEPDNFGLRWEAANGKPSLATLYLSAMDALYQINPEALFFLEGTGQGGIDANWGDGFATDPALIAQSGLSDPNPFFQALLTKPYVNQVVISPHVYPPSVTFANKNFTGAGLWNRLSESFGYLTQKGYCGGTGACKAFPVAIGEFGSRFTDAKDLAMLTDFASYLNNAGAAADGKHKSIPNWFYWSWNPNSGDTGGLVQDDWRTLIWQKINYLATIGLKPWYATETPPVKFGGLCVSVKAIQGLTKDQLQPLTAGDYVFAVGDFGIPACQSVAVGSYTITAPVLTVGTTQYTAVAQNVTVTEGLTSTIEISYKATPIVNTGNFTVGVQLGTAWIDKPGSYNNVLNLYITNTGATAVNVPWSIKIYNGGYTGVASAWNINVDSFTNHTVNGSTAAANQWQKLEPNGGNAVNIGMILSSKTGNFVPSSIKLNGVACKVNVMP